MKSEQPRHPNVTGRLDSDQRYTLIIPAFGTFDTRFATHDVTYHPVPSNYASLGNPYAWRLLLKFGATGQRIVAGLDIFGDTVFGRGSEEPDSPDIDLTNLSAAERGVSRRHALLRPTANKLYIIDLNSTNGTYVNAVPVGRGMAQTIRNHDALAFAGLSCVVEIVSSPLNHQEMPLPETQEDSDPVEVSATLKLGKPTTGKETIVGVKLPEHLRHRPDSGPVPPKTPPEADPEH